MQKSPEYADTVGIQEEGTRPDASPALSAEDKDAPAAL